MPIAMRHRDADPAHEPPAPPSVRRDRSRPGAVAGHPDERDDLGRVPERRQRERQRPDRQHARQDDERERDRPARRVEAEVQRAAEPAPGCRRRLRSRTAGCTPRSPPPTTPRSPAATAPGRAGWIGGPPRSPRRRRGRSRSRCRRTGPLSTAPMAVAMTVGASEASHRTSTTGRCSGSRFGSTSRKPTRSDAPTTRQNTWRDRWRASRRRHRPAEGPSTEDRGGHDLALDADDEQADEGNAAR